MAKSNAYDYFISYRREEYAEDSRLLYETLSSFKKRVYHDVEKSPLGEFKKKLKRAYTHSNTILLLLSPTLFDRCLQEDDLIRKGLEHVLSRNAKNTRDYQLIIPICFDPNYVWPENIPDSITQVKDYQWLILDPARMEDGVRQILAKEDEFWKDLRQKKKNVLTIAEYADYLSRQNKIRWVSTAVLILLTGFLTWFYWPEPLDIKKPIHSWKEAEKLVERIIDEEDSTNFTNPERICNFLKKIRSHDISVDCLNTAITYRFDGVASFLIQNVENSTFFDQADGFTPLMVASAKSLDIVKKIIEKLGDRKTECINHKTEKSNATALFYALSFGEIETAKYLLNNGAEMPNSIICPEKKLSLFTLLIAAKKYDSVKFLLENAGEQQKKDYIDVGAENCSDALMVSLKVENFKISKLLLNNGADLYRKYTVLNVDGLTYLMEAAQEGKISIIKFLVKESGKKKINFINATCGNGDTALNIALSARKFGIAEYLIKHGADLYKTYTMPTGIAGWTHLMLATQTGNLPAVEFLIKEAGKRKVEFINAVASNNMDALMCALMTRNFEIAECLIKNGADLYKTYTMPTGITGWTHLMLAAQAGNLPAVEFLIKEAGKRKVEFINAVASNNMDTLMCALMTRNFEIAECLIKNGADLYKTYTMPTGITGWTHLMLAAQAGNLPAVEFLIKKSGKRKNKFISAVTSNNADALSVALSSEQFKIAEYLIKNGADIFRIFTVGKGKSVKERTYLMEAVLSGNYEIVDFLVGIAGERRAEYIDETDSNGFNALLLALQHHEFKIAKYLIDNGADVFGTSCFKNSFSNCMLLSFAVHTKDREILLFLLRDAGDRKKEMIDHEDEDSWGCTALMYAVLSNEQEFVQILIDEGANLNLINKKGHTALDMAKDDQIRKMLLDAGAKSSSQLKKRKH